MARIRLGLGAALSVLGGLGLVFGPRLGLTELGRPWTFLAGFGVGLVAGLGLVLAAAGLLGARGDGARGRAGLWPRRR